MRLTLRRNSTLFPWCNWDQLEWHPYEWHWLWMCALLHWTNERSNWTREIRWCKQESPRRTTLFHSKQTTTSHPKKASTECEYENSIKKYNIDSSNGLLLSAQVLHMFSLFMFEFESKHFYNSYSGWVNQYVS